MTKLVPSVYTDDPDQLQEDTLIQQDGERVTLLAAGGSGNTVAILQYGSLRNMSTIDDFLILEVLHRHLSANYLYFMRQAEFARLALDDAGLEVPHFTMK